MESVPRGVLIPAIVKYLMLIIHNGQYTVSPIAKSSYNELSRDRPRSAWSLALAIPRLALITLINRKFSQLAAVIKLQLLQDVMNMVLNGVNRDT